MMAGPFVVSPSSSGQTLSWVSLFLFECIVEL